MGLAPWLASKAPGSACLCAALLTQSWGHTHVPPGLLCVCQGSALRSSCLCCKHSIPWAIFPPLALWFLGVAARIRGIWGSSFYSWRDISSQELKMTFFFKVLISRKLHTPHTTESRTFFRCPRPGWPCASWWCPDFWQFLHLEQNESQLSRVFSNR